jgi:hypothetical protein
MVLLLSVGGAGAPVPSNPEPKNCAEAFEPIFGEVPRDDINIRIEAACDDPSEKVMLELFGNGIGIWDGKTQFRLSDDEVKEILDLLRKSKFTSMPRSFGEGIPGTFRGKPAIEEHVTRRVWFTVGVFSKYVHQLQHGPQSKELKEIVEAIRKASKQALKAGHTAKDFDDAMSKLSKRELAPASLELSANFESAKRWMQVRGSVVCASQGERPMRLRLSRKEFQELVDLLPTKAKDWPEQTAASRRALIGVRVLDKSVAVIGEIADKERLPNHKESDRIKQLLDRLWELNERTTKEGRRVRETE